MAGELLCELQTAAVLEIVGDAGCSKRVAAYLVADARILGAALHHSDRIVAVHRMACQLPRSSLRGAKEGSLLLLRYARCLDVLVQILYQIMVREHLVKLATFFMQTHSPLHSALTEVLDRHIHDSAHPREGVDHRAK